MSTRSALLRLDDGSSLRGSVAASLEVEDVKQWLGMQVMAEGIVAFRPSGRPQRIEIDYVAPATSRDLIWKLVPDDGGELASNQGELSALYGQWPGEEDDAEVFETLAELA